jgi:hypothetical protein
MGIFYAATVVSPRDAFDSAGSFPLDDGGSLVGVL